MPLGSTCSVMTPGYNYIAVNSTNWRKPFYDDPRLIRAQGDSTSLDLGTHTITYSATQTMDERIQASFVSYYVGALPAEYNPNRGATGLPELTRRRFADAALPYDISTVRLGE